jgi:hypothetical protein
MSLLDASLATSQELARRPLMERVLGPGGIDESRRPLVQEGSHPYRHTDRGTPPSYSCPPGVTSDGEIHAVGRSCRAWLHCTGGQQCPVTETASSLSACEGG